MSQQTTEVITKSYSLNKTANGEYFSKTDAFFIDIDCVFEAHEIYEYKNGRETGYKQKIVPIYWHLKAYDHNWIEIEVDSNIFSAKDIGKIFHND